MSDGKEENIEVDMGAEGTRTVKMNFPSNAHSTIQSKPEKKEEKKVQKVISGTAVQRKKSFGKKFVETFIGDDIDNVGQYILYDVLIPAAKDTLYDMVKGGFEMLLFPGEKKGSRTRRDRDRSYVSYDKYSSRRDERDRRDVSYRNRATHNFDDIILESRGEAEEVLSNLVDLTIDYERASISDLYDLVGIKANFTDDKWGWTDLRSASVSRVRDGYLLNLPKPVLLD